MADDQSVECPKWRKYQKLVRWTVWRIIRRYGGDFDELFSEALVHYTKAVELYEPYCGSLSNWIQFRVYKGLQTEVRREARRKRALPPSDIDLSLQHARESLLGEIWKDLSLDSQQVLTILFHLDFRYEPRNNSINRLRLRRAVKEILDWANERISDCFIEIEAAVTN